MPRRSREPLDPHMRAELRKRLRRVEPPPVVDASPTPTVDDGFRDTQLCTWIRIPEDVTDRGEDCESRKEEKDQTEREDEVDTEVGEFCRLLAMIRADFETSGRPYAALAADQAIQLVRKGRQDDINPGLWAFVSAREKQIKDAEHPS